MAIRSWGSRRVKRYARGDRSRYDAALHAKIDEVLALLRVDWGPAELTADGWQVHRLTGDRKGAYAVAISGRYRVVFRFEDGDAYDVDVVDYHKS